MAACRQGRSFPSGGVGRPPQLPGAPVRQPALVAASSPSCTGHSWSKVRRPRRWPRRGFGAATLDSSEPASEAPRRPRELWWRTTSRGKPGEATCGGCAWQRQTDQRGSTATARSVAAHEVPQRARWGFLVAALPSCASVCCERRPMPRRPDRNPIWQREGTRNWGGDLRICPVTAITADARTSCGVLGWWQDRRGVRS
jgi:hypothetical protein